MKVMSKCYYFCYLKSHSLTFSPSPTEVFSVVTGDQMKPTVTLSNLLEFSRFELGWKHLG